MQHFLFIVFEWKRRYRKSNNILTILEFFIRVHLSHLVFEQGENQKTNDSSIWYTMCHTSNKIWLMTEIRWWRRFIVAKRVHHEKDGVYCTIIIHRVYIAKLLGSLFTSLLCTWKSTIQVLKWTHTHTRHQTHSKYISTSLITFNQI